MASTWASWSTVAWRPRRTNRSARRSRIRPATAACRPVRVCRRYAGSPVTFESHRAPWHAPTGRSRRTASSRRAAGTARSYRPVTTRRHEPRSRPPPNSSRGPSDSAWIARPRSRWWMPRSMRRSNRRAAQQRTPFEAPRRIRYDAEMVERGRRDVDGAHAGHARARGNAGTDRDDEDGALGLCRPAVTALVEVTVIRADEDQPLFVAVR